jgi:hypothetical protein
VARRTRNATRLKAMSKAKTKINVRYTLEPFEVSRKEALAELNMYLDGDVPDEQRRDGATLRGIAVLGWRIVRSCNLCAEREGSTIPACPNVATVCKKATRGQGLIEDEMYLCEPHSRGKKVRAPRNKP